MTRLVALVGFSFRLPGGSDEQLWERLRSGEDLVTEVNESRWSKEAFFHPDKNEPGRSYTFASGSVGDVRGFDAGFFGISPREAESMDPQQRLLLEMAWEAFERGGIKPSRLRGTNTAVFLGYSGTDYSYRWVDDLAVIDSTSMTGNTGSIAANRLSYLFDLRGPSMSIDTACSSSLVAFHQAWQSIQTGEVSQALVAGVSLHLHPLPFVGFSKASMLSPTGRCRVFDAAGDGYVRSEGGGVFILKDLAAALADGDKVFAVVAGSGVNCDGRTNGITVPSQETQASLLESVYKNSGIDPRDVDYLEAHGTGTAVGDPIETAAIAQVFGRVRSSDDPLLIGSVKSNLGHLEAASGMAGLVKALFCLQHREVPPTIHFRTPNPRIPFGEWNLRVATEPTPLRQDKPLVIGVNSFGFGGANAHVVLCEPPRSPLDASIDPKKQDDRHRPEVKKQESELSQTGQAAFKGHPPLVLSANDEKALRSLAGRYRDFLQKDPGSSLYDICYSALAHRELLPTRCVFDTADKKALLDALDQFANGESPKEVTQEVALSCAASGVVFVFTGNGSQWSGMGQAMLAQSPVFREQVEEIDRLFVAEGGDSILDDLLRPIGEDRYALTEVAQPALFAIQAGIVAVLRDKGIEPAAVIGHSVGEVAAAWVAGALDLVQAVRVVYHRSHMQARTRGHGGMLAAALSAEDTEQLLSELGCAAEVAIAGFNSPKGVTLAGKEEALALVEGRLAEHDVFYRRLPLDYAFHSPAMDPIREPLLGALDNLKLKQGGIPFYSTVTGACCEAQALTAAYWWRNIRDPVQFAQGMGALINDGFNLFLEIGPHSLLRYYVNDCLRDLNVAGRTLTTLLRNDDGFHRIQSAFYSLLLLKGSAELLSWFPGNGRFVDLPLYPWQREDYWSKETEEGGDSINRRRVHPLLGYPSRKFDGVWDNLLDPREYSELADHVVGHTMVFPATGFVEMILAAAYETNESSSQVIEDIEIRAPLQFDATTAKCTRVVRDGNDARVRIESRPRLSDEPWLINAVCRVLEGSLEPVAGERLRLPSRPYDQTRARHYALFEKIGIDYGPAFQTVRGVWFEGDGIVAALENHGDGRVRHSSYHLSPSLLDGSFQTLADLLAGEIANRTGLAYVPVQIARLETREQYCLPAFACGQIRTRSPHSLVADFWLYDEELTLIARVSGLRLRGVRLRHDLLDHTRYLQCRLIPAPLAGAEPIRAGIKLTEAIDTARASLYQPAFEISRSRYYNEVEPLLDGLCSAFAMQALKTLGSNDDVLAVDNLLASNNIASQQEPMLRFLIDLLEEDGLLEPIPDGKRWVPDVELPDPKDIWLSLLGDYPDHSAEIMLTGRAGLNLLEVLTGQRNPATTTPRVCDSNTFAQFVGGSPSLRRIDAALGTIVGRALSNQPSYARLRVLVLTGCQSRAAVTLATKADFARCDMVLATASADALMALEEAVGHYPAAVARLVNFEESPSRWDLGSPSAFDLIVIGGVLHEFPEPVRTLLNLQSLVCQGGLIALVGQQHSRWVDLVFGLDPDWWCESAKSSRRLGLAKSQEVCDDFRAAGYLNPTLLVDDSDNEAGPYLVLAEIPPRTIDSAGSAKRRSYLLLQDQDGYSAVFAEDLVRNLAAAGHSTCVVRSSTDFSETADGYQLDYSAPNQLARLLAACNQHDLPTDIVWLSGLEPKTDEAEVFPKQLLSRQIARCAGVGNLVRAFEHSNPPPAIWLITAGAKPASIPGSVSEVKTLNESAFSGLEDAPLRGFGLSLINEMPASRVRIVDLAEPHRHESMVSGLVSELTAASDEDEIVLTGDGRYASRLSPVGSVNNGDELGAASDEIVKLTFSVPGPLKGLHWTKGRLVPPCRDEVLIDVRAVGLNFRDVMYAMGLLSDEAVENGFAGPTLGMELSGVVVSVGPDVADLSAGDPVIAFAPESFATRVLTRDIAVVPKPDAWSFETAATIPATFFTAYYALVHLARLEEGERVLIHGAAGGVGIAAIQLAKTLGAEVFATAGNDEKRDFLRLLGADHVMDSRSLVFADEILMQTGGGVDVVLNSLAGEAINRNLRVLRPFGRFLELGKRDFYENSRIGLRPFRNNISYFGIDADQLLAERPALTRRLFTEMMALFAGGTLKPLPYRTFRADQVVEAFRYMQQSKQIGKVVVSFDEPPLARSEHRETETRLQLSQDATYLVTGGLGGFGGRTAQWLTERGARHLALISRSGGDAPEARELLERLKTDGVTVKAFACDVTDAEALASVFSVIDTTMPPLRGIVHAAMVIDDGFVRDLDVERIERVFAPKILGALHLDALTSTRSLDFFILYSSATTLFGNPGQASYVAANSFLEALAERRRAAGLPATCIGWGAIDDVGFLARNEEIKASLQSRLGGAALRSHDALDALERLLLHDRSGVGVLDFDWGALQRHLPAAQSPRFSELACRADDAANDSGDAEEIQRLIHELPEPELMDVFIELLKKEVSDILHLPVDRIDEERSVHELGMDSLMGMELGVAVESRFGVALPIMALSERPSIRQLVENIIRQLKAVGPSPEDSGMASMATAIAARHGENVESSIAESVSSAVASRADGEQNSLINKA